MKTVAEVDQEIAKLEKTITQLEADQERNSHHWVVARAVRESLSLDARVNGGDAARQLEEARLEQKSIEYDIEDTNSALAQARKTLDELNAKKRELYRREALQHYEAEGKALIADGHEAQRLAKLFVAVLGKIKMRLVKMDDLASKAEPEPRHKKIEAHLRRAVRQQHFDHAPIDLRLEESANFLFKNTRQYYVQPIAEIFRRTLAGGAVEEIQQKTGS
jgi:phage shock protein A